MRTKVTFSIDPNDPESPIGVTNTTFEGLSNDIQSWGGYDIEWELEENEEDEEDVATEKPAKPMKKKWS